MMIMVSESAEASVCSFPMPAGMLGLFCLLMILAMISTDDSRIFSATITISQDVILPFIKKELTQKQHIWLLRGVSIAIGVCFYLWFSEMHRNGAN